MKIKIDIPIFHVAFYLIGFLLLFIAHKIAPSSLAGPGLDMLVLFLLTISILTLLIGTLVTKSISVFSKIAITVVHVLGVAVIIWLMKQPS